MAPVLLALRKTASWPGRAPAAALEAPIDEADCCRCIVRLVWTFSTDVGVGVCLRRAAAAADEESLALAFAACDARKACAAAVCAENDGLGFMGYMMQRYVG